MVQRECIIVQREHMELSANFVLVWGHCLGCYLHGAGSVDDPRCWVWTDLSLLT